MAYDEQLAARIRQLIGTEPGLTERKMFGGLAFLINGNMTIAASGQGGALMRVDPSDSQHLLDTTSARLMEMRGRQMAGWLRVDTADIQGDDELMRWIERCVTYARRLPTKNV